jgi:hypothetical protein
VDWRHALEVVSDIAGEDLARDLEGIATAVASLERLLEEEGVVVPS